MGIYDFLDTFAGFPVVRSDESTTADPATVAWRLTNYYAPERFEPLLEELLDRTGPAGPSALIVEEWGASHQVPFPVEVLTRNADRLRGLRALFIGELSAEQCEISWIKQGDVTPVLQAFPDLEHLWIRGSDGLALAPVRHENLRDLVLQSGGLRGEVVRAVAACDFPLLEELELWLGTTRYGGDATVEDLTPILSGHALPALDWLGLRNADFADEIAAAVAAAPIVARLRVLDLSMGTLGDRGAEALLAGQPLSHLHHLLLSHHYMTRETAARLVAALPTVTVDVSDELIEEAEEGYFVAVGE